MTMKNSHVDRRISIYFSNEFFISEKVNSLSKATVTL